MGGCGQGLEVAVEEVQGAQQGHQDGTSWVSNQIGKKSVGREVETGVKAESSDAIGGKLTL